MKFVDTNVDRTSQSLMEAKFSEFYSSSLQVTHNLAHSRDSQTAVKDTGLEATDWWRH